MKYYIWVMNFEESGKKNTKMYLRVAAVSTAEPTDRLTTGTTGPHTKSAVLEVKSRSTIPEERFHLART